MRYATLYSITSIAFRSLLISHLVPIIRSQMETVIKQAEENRTRSLNIANRIHEEYMPLKGEVDHMRREYLGLSPLPDLHEEEGSVIAAEYVYQLNQHLLCHTGTECAHNSFIHPYLPFDTAAFKPRIIIRRRAAPVPTSVHIPCRRRISHGRS